MYVYALITMTNNILNPSTSQFQYLVTIHYHWHAKNKLTLDFPSPPLIIPFPQHPPVKEETFSISCFPFCASPSMSRLKTTRIPVGFPNWFPSGNIRYWKNKNKNKRKRKRKKAVVNPPTVPPLTLVTSVVNRPARPAEPLGRSVGLISGSWSVLSDSGSRTWSIRLPWST